MTHLDPDSIRQIIRQEGRCVSLYLPTFPDEHEIDQNPIRLKNLLKQAEERLLGDDLRRRDALALLAPARSLIANRSFWREQGRGLALFLGGGAMRVVKSPTAFDELVVVAGRFHVKELFPVVSDDLEYRLLAISKRGVQLFACGETRFEPLHLDVTSFEEYLADDDVQNQLQFHTDAARGRGDNSVAFHGHGGGGDASREKKQLLNYFSRVDHAISSHLHENGSLRLVLAGLDHLVAAYRQVSGYSRIVERSVSRNPDDLPPSELHGVSREIIQEQRGSAVQSARERFLAANSGVTLSEIESVLPAAEQGRVGMLMVPGDRIRWGRYDRWTQQAAFSEVPGPGDVDLYDLAAAETHLHGGTVFVLEECRIPGPGDVAAVVRY